MLALLLAVTISTSDNSAFFNIPSWMPTEVASTNTPGSGDYTNHNSLSVVDAAALQAVFDGYCERIYELNRGDVNLWDESIFGGRLPIDFQFPVDFGDRSVPTNVERAIRGIDVMRTVGCHMGFGDMTVSRPSWDFANVYLGSSKISFASPDGSTQTDAGMPYTSAWTERPFDVETSNPRKVMRPLCSLAEDSVYNSSPNGGALVNAYMSIAHGFWPSSETNKSYFSALSTTSYPTAVTNLFGDRTYDLTSVQSPTNALLGKQPWQGAAGRALYAMDRSYTTAALPKCPTNITYSFSGSRKAKCTKTGSFSVSPTDWTLGSEITIGANDWDVESLEVKTNGSSLVEYEGNHPAYLRVSERNVSRGVAGVGSVIDSLTVTRRMCEDALVWRAMIPTETNTYWFYGSVSEGSGEYAWVLSEQLGMEDGSSTPVANLYITSDPITLSGMELTASASSSYSYETSFGSIADYSRKVRSSTAKSVNEMYSLLGSCYITCEDGSNCLFKAECGSGSSLSSTIETFVQNLRAKMSTEAHDEWGDYDDPSSYASLSQDDISPSCRVGRMSAMMGGSGYRYRVEATGDGESVTVTDCQVYDDTGGYIGTVDWYGLSVVNVLTVALAPSPSDITYGSNITSNRAGQVANGSACVIQRFDYTFDALK